MVSPQARQRFDSSRLFLETRMRLGTCFSFPGFDIDDHSPVLLREVLQDDDVMGLIGAIHVHTAGPHAEDLERDRDQGHKSGARRRRNGPSDGHEPGALCLCHRLQQCARTGTPESRARHRGGSHGAQRSHVFTVLSVPTNRET